MTIDSIGMLILGAIIGFLVSIAKDWLMENRKDKEKKKQFKREKLEEIFVLLDKVNQNALNPIQLYDESVETAKLTMMIRFYFPDTLHEVYKDFLSNYTEVHHVKLAGQNYMDKYMQNLSKVYSDFCSKLTEESRKYL
jgi:hypothetical protein